MSRTLQQKARQLGLTVKQALSRPLLLSRLRIKGLTRRSPE